jgi:hypothetical protein
MFDIFEFIIGATIAIVLTAFAAGMITFGLDFRHAIKAEPKVFACNAVHMDSKRISFTDSVICVPYPSRQDTVTINGVK